MQRATLDNGVALFIYGKKNRESFIEKTITAERSGLLVARSIEGMSNRSNLYDDMIYFNHRNALEAVYRTKRARSIVKRFYISCEAIINFIVVSEQSPNMNHFNDYLM